MARDIQIMGMMRKCSTCKVELWLLLQWASNLGFLEHFFFFLFDAVDDSGLSMNSGFRFSSVLSRLLDKVPSGPSFCLFWVSFFVLSCCLYLVLDIFSFSLRGLFVIWRLFPERNEDLSLSPRQHLGMTSAKGLSVGENFPDSALELKRVVWICDVSTHPSNSSLFSCLRSFPARNSGTWHSNSELEPLKRLNQSHKVLARQSQIH